MGPQGMDMASTAAVVKLLGLLTDVVDELRPQLRRETNQDPGECSAIAVFRFRSVYSDELVLDVLVNGGPAFSFS